jgi:SIR2-like protein
MPDAKYSSSLHYWIDFSDLYQRSEAISQAYSSGNLAFFLGSGASKAYVRSMPNWPELLTDLLGDVQFGDDEHRKEIQRLLDQRKYLVAAEAIKRLAMLDGTNRDLAIDHKVGRILGQRLRRVPENPILHLAVLDFATPVITTNFDTILETVIQKYDVAGYSLNPITYEDQNDAAIRLNPTVAPESFVFKVHGTVSKAQRLIVDENDYADFYFQEMWPKSLQLLRHLLSTKMVVFLGFSLSDPEVMLILREATRYASSYQHVALMHQADITPIEREILRTSYRVDPIVYDDHQQLPLFVMEMRNFNRRDGLPLQLRDSRETLLRAANMLRVQGGVGASASIVLFGSYAKYGKLTYPGADIDMLFLSSAEPEMPSLRGTAADAVAGRKIDATFLSRDELVRLLRIGDAFATSILVTGSPLDDPGGAYGLISRGFRPSYHPDEIYANALDRYRARWLRLCLFEGPPTQERLKACHQWAVTLMQLLLLKHGYRTDTVLSLSLLGNPRYTIHRFAARFSSLDEGRFLAIMRGAKGLLAETEAEWPPIEETAAHLVRALRNEIDAEELDLLTPSTLFLGGASSGMVGTIYWDLHDQLLSLVVTAPDAVIGYQAHETFRELVAAMTGSDGQPVGTFDWLFIVRLHRTVAAAGLTGQDDPRWPGILAEAQQQWKGIATATRPPAEV